MSFQTKQYPVPFQGETMTCYQCKTTQQSSPYISSGWAQMEGPGISKAVCPKCMGWDDPKCPQCGNYRDRYLYSACPWCERRDDEG